MGQQLEGESTALRGNVEKWATRRREIDSERLEGSVEMASFLELRRGSRLSIKLI